MVKGEGAEEREVGQDGAPHRRVGCGDPESHEVCIEEISEGCGKGDGAAPSRGKGATGWCGNHCRAARFSMEPMMGRWSIPCGVVFQLRRAWSNHVSPAIVRPLL
jgi:hypothetical protein